ncbi:MAG TPA: polysaccharide biosynthesis tyrosine autokinase [Bryobacteraceae bacterium]|nr:polysaccharide biosynthesis tyrosine autokinase [Bryobacteraceae bacterium]
MSRIYQALRRAESPLGGFRDAAPLSSPADQRDYLEPASPLQSEDTGIIRQAIAAMRSHWIAFVLIVIVCTSASLLLSLTKPPVYRARALVEVLGVNENFLNLHSVEPNTVNTEATGSIETYLRTQLEILQSETVVGRVIDKLHLDTRPEYQAAPAGTVNRLYSSLGKAPAVRANARENAISAAMANLRVQTSKQASMLAVSFGSTDRQLAAAFVNELTEQYNEEAFRSRLSATNRTGEWLQSQLLDAKRKLEASEAALQAANRSMGLLATDSGGSVAEEKLRQLQQELSKAEADRIEKQSLYEMTQTNSQNLPAVLDDGPLREYQMKLADLRRQEAEQSVLLTPTSYKVERLHAQIQELESTLAKERSNISGRIRNNYEAATVRESLLRTMYAKQTTAVEELSRKMVGYNTFKHAVESSRLMYDSMLQKVNDVGVASAVRASNVRVVDPASVPTVPSEPNIPLNLAIGFTSGLLLGICWVAARESRNSRFSRPGRVGLLLRVPELGVVPSISRAPEKRLTINAAAGKTAMPSLLTDSFRAIVTSLLCSGRPVRVLTVTSPGPGDGKTTISANLAASLAGIGQKVLLIEGDPRSQRLQDALGAEGKLGLSDLAANNLPVEESALASYVQPTKIPGVFLLSTGTKPEDIPFLLYSRKTELLLRQFRPTYDTIIFDTPPLLLAPEARVCGRLSDGVVLVLRAERTTREMAIACQTRLAEDGTTLLGTILNDVDIDPTTHNYYSSTKHRRADGGELTIACQ